MTMRWGMVTDKPQEFLGCSLCQTPQGYTFGVSGDHVTKLCKDFGFGELKGSNTLSFEKPDDNDTILDESGQRRHRQLLGRLLWLGRPDIKNAVCQLSTQVGTATTRDEINIKRLLGYLIGNPACNMIVGCIHSARFGRAATLELQFGSWVLLKTRGIPCTRPPRSRTWFV